MTIDWDKFQEDVDAAIEQAGNRTDEELAGKLSGVTRLSDDEIQRMFPDPADCKKLSELMQIVRSSTKQNEKINRIVENAEHFGSVIFALLQKLA